MNYREIEDACIELEFFDDPEYNYEDNEDDIIDQSHELALDDDEGADLWEAFEDEYDEEFTKSFLDENGDPIEYDDEEALYNEILKYAKEFASIILKINEYDNAYNITVSVNAYGTGEQYTAEDIIERYS